MPPSDKFDLLTDDEVAKRLTRDATDWSLRYSAVGLESKTTPGPGRPATLARPNTQFLSNQIRQNMSHNTIRKKARTAAQEDDDDLWGPRRSPRVKKASKKAEEKRSDEEKEEEEEGESKKKQAKERLAKQREQRSKKRDHVHNVRDGRVQKGQARDEPSNNGRTTTWSQKIIAAREERNNDPTSKTNRKPVKESPWSIKHQLRREDRHKEDREEDVIYCAYKSFNAGYYWVTLDDDSEDDRTDLLSSKSLQTDVSQPDSVEGLALTVRENTIDPSPPLSPKAHISPHISPTYPINSRESLDKPFSPENHEDSLNRLASRIPSILCKASTSQSSCKPHRTVKRVRFEEPPTYLQPPAPSQQASPSQQSFPGQRASISPPPSRRSRSVCSDRGIVRLVVSPKKLRRTIDRCVVKLDIQPEELKWAPSNTGDSEVEAPPVSKDVMESSATPSKGPAALALNKENMPDTPRAAEFFQAPEPSPVSPPLPLSSFERHDSNDDPPSPDIHEAATGRSAFPGPEPIPPAPESLSPTQPVSPVVSPLCSPDDRLVSPTIEAAENHSGEAVPPESHPCDRSLISPEFDSRVEKVATPKSKYAIPYDDFATLLALATRAVSISGAAHHKTTLVRKRKVPDESLTLPPSKRQKFDPAVEMPPPDIRTMEPPVELSPWLRSPKRAASSSYGSLPQFNQPPPPNLFATSQPSSAQPNQSPRPSISTAPCKGSLWRDQRGFVPILEPGQRTFAPIHRAGQREAVPPPQRSNVWQSAFQPIARYPEGGNRGPGKLVSPLPQSAVAREAAVQPATAPLLKAPACGLRLVCPVLPRKPRPPESGRVSSAPPALGCLASTLGRKKWYM